MSTRKRMKVKQVMRYLNRSRSGLSSVSDKLKPIPNTNPTAEREFWRDEVEEFKRTNPVRRQQQNGGRKSRRRKVTQDLLHTLANETVARL